MLKKRPFKRRKHLYEGLSQLLEMPQESLSSVPIFHMCGDNEMEITGCDGILEYTDEKIVLSAGKDKAKPDIWLGHGLDRRSVCGVQW